MTTTSSILNRTLEAALINKTSARVILDSVTSYGPDTRLASVYQDPL